MDGARVLFDPTGVWDALVATDMLAQAMPDPARARVLRLDGFCGDFEETVLVPDCGVEPMPDLPLVTAHVDGDAAAHGSELLRVRCLC